MQGVIAPRKFRQPRIAIIGFGDVGKRLLAQRMNQPGARLGPSFLAVSRSGNQLSQEHKASGPIHRPVHFLNWDMDLKQSALRIASIADYFIVLMPPSERSSEDMRSRKLACAIRRKNRLFCGVYISTTGVYGDHQGGRVDETSRCQPKSARSLRRLAAEKTWRPMGMHVLRVPGIYAHDRLPLGRLSSREPALRAEDDVFTNHVHADDLAKITYAAVFRGKPGRVTNAVDQTEMKMADYFDAVASACGLPKPPRISREEMLARGAKGEVNSMMLSFLSESRRVTTKRLEKELRLTLSFPTVADTLKTLT